MEVQEISLDWLLQKGLTMDQAKKLLDDQTAPKSKEFYYRFKATPEKAAQVRDQFPGLNIERQTLTQKKG